MAERIEVEVAYFDGDEPAVRRYTVPAGATIGDALQMLQRDWNAEAWLSGARDVGVFGRVVGREMVLSPGDRVELYRPLLNDPKTARRQRARLAVKRR